MSPTLARLAAALLATTAVGAHAADGQFWYDANHAYLSPADIPFGFYDASGPTVLDTLESGQLNAQLSASHGNLIGPGEFSGFRDSVDSDDGTIDGNCGPQSSACRSWFNNAGSQGVTFSYQGGGALPTAFGLVWTDGGGSVTFSAVAADGHSLGTFTVAGTEDGSFAGGTDEDRFFGMTFAGGIRSITISNNSGGIELDHIQFGQMAAPVPEPGTWAMFLAGGLALGLRRRARRAA